MLERGMSGSAARTRPWVTNMPRRMVLIVAVASALQPGIAAAAPATSTTSTTSSTTASQTAPDLVGFDREFRAGQEQFNRKQYREAAKVWLGAADLLPETEEHKENRRAIYEYIAEAYEKAIAGEADEHVMREGLEILDAYAETFAAAYPADSLPEHVAKTRLDFRTRIDEFEAERRRSQRVAAPPPVAATRPVPPPSKPWKGLAIGGGVAVAGGAAMLALFAAGLAGAKSSESQFDDPANACDLAQPAGKCVDINSRGKAANGMAVAGLVTAPLLLGTGIALLVLATRRKSANRSAMAPMFSRNMAGLVWQHRF